MNLNPAICKVLDRIYFRHSTVIDEISLKMEEATSRKEDYLLYNAPLGIGSELRSYFSALGYEVVLHKGHNQDMLAFGW